MKKNIYWTLWFVPKFFEFGILLTCFIVLLTYNFEKRVQDDFTKRKSDSDSAKGSDNEYENSTTPSSPGIDMTKLVELYAVIQTCGIFLGMEVLSLLDPMIKWTKIVLIIITFLMGLDIAGISSSEYSARLDWNLLTLTILSAFYCAIRVAEFFIVIFEKPPEVT